MDETWFQQYLEYDFEILGFKLERFTFGHHCLLNRVDSPFVVDRNEFIFDDLLLALLICSLPYDEAKRINFNSSKYISKVEEAGRKVESKDELTEAVDLFLKYIQAYNRQPDFKILNKGGGAVGSPGWLVVSMSLQKELHRTESVIMNEVCGKVFTDYYVLRELEGSIAVISEEEADVIKAAQKIYDECDDKTFGTVITNVNN